MQVLLQAAFFHRLGSKSKTSEVHVAHVSSPLTSLHPIFTSVLDDPGVAEHVWQLDTLGGVFHEEPVDYGTEG